MLSKKPWLSVAEVIDAWRIFPRLIVGAYGGWTAWFINRMWNFYETLPPEQRTAQMTAVIGSVSGGVFGLAAYVARIYMPGGRDWSKPEPGQSAVEWNLPDNKDQ